MGRSRRRWAAGRRRARDPGRDGAALLDQAVTSASGIYTVKAPGPGSYRVRVVLPPGGAGFAPENAGANDQLDSDINASGLDLGFTDIFVLASNVISTTTIDAGLIDVPPTGRILDPLPDLPDRQGD